MTEKYLISINPRISGCHTVHRQGCPFLPAPGRRILLGVFQSSREAVKEGRRYFGRADCCPFCSKENNGIKREAFPVEQVNQDVISSARVKNIPLLDLVFCSLS